MKELINRLGRGGKSYDRTNKEAADKAADAGARSVIEVMLKHRVISREDARHELFSIRDILTKHLKKVLQ